MSTVQGNASKKVEIVVLETSASYCPAERVANNRGDFRFGQLTAAETQPPSANPPPPPKSPHLHLRPQVTRVSPSALRGRKTSFHHSAPSPAAVFRDLYLFV